jgi:hypothetical protein
MEAENVDPLFLTAGKFEAGLRPQVSTPSQLLHSSHL